MKIHPLQSQTHAIIGSFEQHHTLELPPCCPRSQNPRPGSAVTISYQPSGKSIEVGSLFAYIHSYKGGLRDEDGTLLARDMEGMIHRIAQDCANAVHVGVTVVADLVLLPRQEMRIVAHSLPVVEESIMEMSTTDLNARGCQR